MVVRLSDGEKLILVMLSELYKHLKISGEVDPKFVQEAILSGHTWGLSWQHPGIFGADDYDDSTVRETAEILTMWRIIEISYQALSAPERERVAREAAPFGADDVRFEGFDGNDDAHYSITCFLVEHLERFQELKGRELNSHGPVIESYRRMLPIYNHEHKRPTASDHLSADQLIQILKARAHPGR